MTKNMLIDAAHTEEVRVCVLENGKVEDFDFESSSRKPLRGNIYLARVTRVEPSLQAAFVEYGGNRHGFLAFNEIHPDYYQIPVSDRRILQEAEAEEAALAAELELDENGEGGDDDLDLDRESGAVDDDEPDFRDGGDAGEREARGRHDGHDHDAAENGGANSQDDEAEEAASGHADSEHGDSENSEETAPDAAPMRADEPESISQDYAPHDESEDAPSEDAAESQSKTDDAGDEEQGESHAESDNAAEDAANGDQSGPHENGDADGEPARQSRAPRGQNGGRNPRRAELLERYKEARRKRARLVRNYKIQEVVKRRQILLVQVVKEERGNKGAALTTYMSLAGRYCVLMPNTARGGGISRKIPVATDRKRLRRVVDSLDVPQGMGLIIRTAGAKRTKAEIKRDYDYLIRLWENIRTLTLNSIAPSLIYEEANLIKRAIRDLYDKDIDQIEVEGDAGYREAKDFMKMLMPSHAKNVQPYKEKTPLFLKYGVESQLDAMYQPTVRLKSGGYIVISQTEALIAIDVNSGKSTRERNIELTALKTNLEAAKEAARQCRLRDLAGLIVIDFIDMEENKNNRSVEKRLKDSLKTDRARIQVGRISNFGLLEMSRQRRRSGIVDGTTHACPACGGAGVVRSHEMAALRILRAVESEALTARSALIAIKASMEVTLYILNHKRAWLKRIEDDYALTIEILADSSKAGDQYEIEKRGAPRDLPEAPAFVRADLSTSDDKTEAPEEEIAAADDEPEDEEEDEGRESRGERPHRRESGNREHGGRDGGREAGGENADGSRRKRRRRRRGGRGGDGEHQQPRHADQAQPRHDQPRHDEDSSEQPVIEMEPAGDGERPANGDLAANGPAHAREDSDGQRRRRRRGRRGGRRNQRRDEFGAEGQRSDAPSADGAPAEIAVQEQPDYPDQPDFADRTEAREEREPPREEAPAAQISVRYEPPSEEPPAKSWREERASQETPLPDPEAPEPAATESENQSREPKPTRKGWWQRAIGG